MTQRVFGWAIQWWISSGGPDFSESFAVRHTIMALCMTKRKVEAPSIAAAFCVSKKIKKEIKSGNGAGIRRGRPWDQYLPYNYPQLPGLLGDQLEMRERKGEMDRETHTSWESFQGLHWFPLCFLSLALKSRQSGEKVRWRELSEKSEIEFREGGDGQ